MGSHKTGLTAYDQMPIYVLKGIPLSKLIPGTVSEKDRRHAEISTGADTTLKDTWEALIKNIRIRFHEFDTSKTHQTDPLGVLVEREATSATEFAATGITAYVNSINKIDTFRNHVNGLLLKYSSDARTPVPDHIVICVLHWKSAMLWDFLRKNPKIPASQAEAGKLLTDLEGALEANEVLYASWTICKNNLVGRSRTNFKKRDELTAPTPKNSTEKLERWHRIADGNYRAYQEVLLNGVERLRCVYPSLPDPSSKWDRLRVIDKDLEMPVVKGDLELEKHKAKTRLAAQSDDEKAEPHRKKASTDA